jgi:hypothetical protein
MDEGWTRLLLEQFGIPYATVMDAEIKKGNLNAKYDLILLPDDLPALITGEGIDKMGGWFDPASTPPEYRTGIGAEGTEALKAFVKKGGTLLTLGEACGFAIDKFALPVRDTIAGVSRKDFWCPGSTVRMTYDSAHPLAYGLPAEGLAIYQMGNPVFEIVRTDWNERAEIPVAFAERNLLRSGWLIGESYLSRKAAVVSLAYGEGRVILCGIRPQHRAQTHGTFKLLFNAIFR